MLHAPACLALGAQVCITLCVCAMVCLVCLACSALQMVLSGGGVALDVI